MRKTLQGGGGQWTGGRTTLEHPLKKAIPEGALPELPGGNLTSCGMPTFEERASGRSD